ncbi:MAG: ABC transporter permease [Armatimonadota bacterium]|nr:ABC transporter permease [Armatimonadota bacterium]
MAISTHVSASPEAAGPRVPRSMASSVWRRLLRHRLAAVGAVIVLGLVLVAVFAPVLAPYDPVKQDLGATYRPSSAEHWLGTDEFGRDILSRIIYGARVSLLVGVVSVGIGLTLGTVAGLVAGYLGGRLDSAVMGVMDVLLAVPGVLLAIAIVAVLGPGIGNVMVAVGISSIPVFARLARGSVLVVRETEYVEAVHALGGSAGRVLFRHILPNIAAPLLVMASLHMASAILTAAGLSYLGLGAQPPSPEWGAMLSRGREYLRTAPHIATYPGLAIFVSVMGFNFLGDGLRDALDPRLRI